MSKVGLIQMTSVDQVEINLCYIEQQVETLAKQGADWIVTPENALLFASKESYHRFAQPIESSSTIERLAQCAQKYGVWLIIGSMPIRTDEGSITTTCVVINALGQVAASYDKLHMFDVDVADRQRSYRESETFCPGNQVQVVDTPFGRIGLSICYDVRFPNQYAMLRQLGAQIMLVPAAFTVVTGKAHWQVLLQARAIETQSWVVAVGQCGVHSNDRETWGHSMVISPWGDIVAQAREQTENLLVDIDLSSVESIRTSMPVFEHCRFTSQLIDKKNPV